MLYGAAKKRQRDCARNRRPENPPPKEPGGDVAKGVKLATRMLSASAVGRMVVAATPNKAMIAMYADAPA